MSNRRCRVCSTTLIKRYAESRKSFSFRKFCSHKCYWVDKKGKDHKTHQYVYSPCDNCEKKVKVYPSDKTKFHYCSRECSRIGRTTKKLLICSICKKRFFRIKSRIYKCKISYCSRNCYTESQKGFAPMKGKKCSLASRKKMSISQIKRFDRDGRSNLYFTYRNLYIRGSLKYKIWRNQVFKRDNYTCQKCGAKSDQGKRTILNADHIVSFAKLLHKHSPQNLKEAYDIFELWDINNGRTLCINCHKNTENYGGKGHGSYNFAKVK